MKFKKRWNSSSYLVWMYRDVTIRGAESELESKRFGIFTVFLSKCGVAVEKYSFPESKSGIRVQKLEPSSRSRKNLNFVIGVEKNENRNRTWQSESISLCGRIQSRESESKKLVRLEWESIVSMPRVKVWSWSRKMYTFSSYFLYLIQYKFAFLITNFVLYCHNL